MLCHDVFCCDPMHIAQVDTCIQDINQACLQAAKITIHHTSANNSGCIPGMRKIGASYHSTTRYVRQMHIKLLTIILLILFLVTRVEFWNAIKRL